jgi:hypothetical protein
LLGITALSQSPISSLGGTNVNVAVTGIQLTSSLNSVTIKADANAFPTSQLLTSTVDNVTVALNTPVDLLGEELTINLRRRDNKSRCCCRFNWRTINFYYWYLCYCSRWKCKYYCWC